MKAYLMNRDKDPSHGVTEWWSTEDGRVLYVDFNADIRETMVFPYDVKRCRVKSWNELGVWHKDMTGGSAMRKLGYEPVEEGDSDGTD